MANLRKLVAAALSGADLSQNDIEETAIDRIGAMAFSGSLGGELWRLKEGHDLQAFDRALALLVKKVRKPHDSRSWFRKMCAVALREWIDRKCRECGGRGMIQATTIAAQHTCTKCDGSGVRRYSDQWRMAQLRLTPGAYAKWEPRLGKIHEAIAEADREEYTNIAKQLERIMPNRRYGKKVVDFSRARAKLARNRSDDRAQTDNYMPGILVSSTAGAD